MLAKINLLKPVLATALTLAAFGVAQSTAVPQANAQDNDTVFWTEENCERRVKLFEKKYFPTKYYCLEYVISAGDSLWIVTPRG